MVACAVLSCKRRSGSSNSQQDHVSYHKFPKDLIIKEKWKKFCNYGNDSWKPTRTSVICSEHFTPESYCKNANNRNILVEGAVPSLRLCPCLGEPPVKIRKIEPTTCSDVVTRSSQCLIDKPTENKDMSTILIIASSSVAPPPETTIPSTQGAFCESPRERKLRTQLQSKNKKNRLLRDKNRYLKREVETLKELLTNLEKKSLINKEENMILKTIGVTEKEFPLEFPNGS